MLLWYSSAFFCSSDISAMVPMKPLWWWWWCAGCACWWWWAAAAAAAAVPNNLADSTSFFNSVIKWNFLVNFELTEACNRLINEIHWKKNSWKLARVTSQNKATAATLVATLLLWLLQCYFGYYSCYFDSYSCYFGCYSCYIGYYSCYFAC